MRKFGCWLAGTVLGFCIGGVQAQTSSQGAAAVQAKQPSAATLKTTPGRVRPPDVLKPPTKDDLLRGAYGPYRANNDLLFYKLKLRVDPTAKTISGTNLIDRFRMLQPGQKIQLDLTPEAVAYVDDDSIRVSG
jgi:hypothetical protein